MKTRVSTQSSAGRIFIALAPDRYVEKGRRPTRADGVNDVNQDTAPVCEARDLTRVYTVRRGMLQKPATLQAVGGISFSPTGDFFPSGQVTLNALTALVRCGSPLASR